MNRFRSSISAKLIALVSMSLFIFPFTGNTAQGNSDAATRFKTRPPKYFVPGNRIRLETNIKADSGLDQVRCYFRAGNQENYSPVLMEDLGGDQRQTILPAPKRETRSLEYLFLSVNSYNVVTRTQTFS